MVLIIGAKPRIIFPFRKCIFINIAEQRYLPEWLDQHSPEEKTELVLDMEIFAHSYLAKLGYLSMPDLQGSQNWTNPFLYNSHARK